MIAGRRSRAIILRARILRIRKRTDRPMEKVLLFLLLLIFCFDDMKSLESMATLATSLLYDHLTD